VEVVIDTADGRCCHPKFEEKKEFKGHNKLKS